MDDFKFELTVGRPDYKDLKKLTDGLLSHHAKSGHQRISEIINIFIKDKRKEVHGGAIATVLWNGIEINSLWVEEQLRGKGLGKKLVEMIEEQGRLRGCDLIYTNTFDWQGSQFYEKLGFKAYGKLDDFPHGSSLTYYFKKL